VKPFGAIQVERVEFVRGFDTILKIAPAPMGNAVFISSGSGRIIAGLGEDVVGSSLVLFNPNGTIAVGLETMPDGGFIGIRDKDGRSCVHLSGRPFWWSSSHQITSRTSPFPCTLNLTGFVTATG
jgi:hypothetical protein